jgi:hypothetical protein
MIHTVKPIFFYGIGGKLHPVLYVRPGMSAEVRMEILLGAYEALKDFMADEYNAEMLPRSVEKFTSC